ncbi:MAG: prepilin-type N-terminal cleavage/methylation domain-containing protein [Deltaproteobacteria bacterium]|nr:prepilin-type N-terminal cleavage/methylation domain-containing protein [Deltaproteobacteria bacterium]
MNIWNGRSKGFTLIELLMVIVLLGIVSATAVVVIGNILSQQSFDATLKEMNDLKAATIGNPDLIENGARSSFGYTGDMGPLPPTTGVCPACGLVELVAQGARPAWVADAQLPGTGYGWRGPYIDAKQDDSARYLALLDGWGNYYSYNAATGVITSNGPDGAVGGGDDITWPGAAITTTGIVTGRVTDRNGTSVVANNVTITYPNPASPGNSTTTVNATNADGVFTLNAIPLGKHKIQTTVSGTTYTKTAVVLASQTMIVDFNAAGDPTTPNAPTAVLATRASLSGINLTWTAPTLNTDGSTLVDLGSYNIYRSIDGGVTYPLLQSMGLGTSFSNTSLTAGQRYIYRMTAVDKSGNPSANSATSSTTVSPIRQSGAATAWSSPANGGATCATTSDVEQCATAANRRKALFTINNAGNAADNGANITVNSMVITWGTTGGVVRKILAADTTTIRYCDAAAAGGTASGTTTTLSAPLVINAGASSTMGIYFCTTGAQPTFVSVQFNTSDGYFTLY